MVDDIRGRATSRLEDNADEEPSFVPPETVAADEVVIDMSNPEEGEPETKSPKHALGSDRGSKVQSPKKPSKLKLWATDIKYWWGKRSKKEKLAIAAGALVGLAIAAFGIYTITKPKPVQQKAPVAEKKEEVKVPPKPTTEASRLTGMQISPELNQLTVTAVMIENSPDARPQAGLKDAGVVFEAIAEGGITRFLTLFQEAQPDYIGPVRSVRPYYVSWLSAFDAAVAHAGGSPEALAKIRSQGIKDLDQFANGGAYQRVNNRFAPHNLYTSRSSLIALERSKGFNNSTFTGFLRKADKAITPATTKAINFDVSGPLYAVHYDYDTATNSYLRSLAGQPHKDERSGARLNPKVVIGIVVPYSIHPDGVHSVYGTVGNGKAYIFQDGGVIECTWSKASDKDQITFVDGNGAPIGLNAGQTWITAVADTGRVAYTP